MNDQSIPFMTIFTAPKPFTNPHIATIQRNAIRSWLALGDQVAVILLGNEDGIAETAEELRTQHLPDVEHNDKGTPLVSSIFKLAHQFSQSPVMTYANADMILLSDFLPAVQQVAGLHKDFLVVGRRWNLDITEPITFNDHWERKLREEIQAKGKLYTPYGIDYFVFPRHLYTQVPDFAIGRPAWDNWMVHHATDQGWLVLEATESITVVHQNHDYSHLPQGKPPYGSEEALRNIALAGGLKNIMNITDAKHRLVNGIIRRQPLTLVRLIRLVERCLITDRQQGWRWWLVLKLRKAQLKIWGLES
ncbi:MAG: hypothetical protein IBX69_10995 [Anaerolineales bacterium]|nr:hypothetical protein [Anaerolineales bacterium]